MSGRNVAVIEREGDALAERFLELVSATGNSSSAARALGTHRNTWYKRAVGDADFRARWDGAQLASRRVIAEEVLDKAMVATGRVVEEVQRDPVTGEVLLDDDLEPVVVRRLVDSDSRILAKMLDKFVGSEDGPAVTAVQVNNVMPPPPAAPPPLPRPTLVFEDAPPADAPTGAAEEPERVTDATWEPT